MLVVSRTDALYHYDVPALSLECIFVQAFGKLDLRYYGVGFAVQEFRGLGLLGAGRNYDYAACNFCFASISRERRLELADVTCDSANLRFYIKIYIRVIFNSSYQVSGKI